MSQQNSTNRREFIKKASIGGIMSLSVPDLVASAFSPTKASKIALSKNSTILFQGDSITDASRNRTKNGVNDSGALGVGYAFLASSELLFKKPDSNLNIYNRGISGNKVYQLAERWEEDCLNLKPDVLSIMIGVNDFWHKLNGRYEGTIETYRNDYTALLDKTKQKLPDVKLIIGEPFAVAGIKAVDEKWYPAFDEYRQVAREVADKFDAVFVPYQSVFDKAQKSAPGVYWTYDGVHPSLAGAQLMAHAWLEAVK